MTPYEAYQGLYHLALEALSRSSTREERAYREHLRSFAFDHMRAEQTTPQARQRFVFRPVDGNSWEIGKEGDTHTADADSPTGARMAYLAFSRRTPLWTELTGAKDAGRVLRKAKQITAEWAERHGCMPLATAVRSLRIRKGRVFYEERPGAPVFLLSPVPFGFRDAPPGGRSEAP